MKSFLRYILVFILGALVGFVLHDVDFVENALFHVKPDQEASIEGNTGKAASKPAGITCTASYEMKGRQVSGEIEMPEKAKWAEAGTVVVDIQVDWKGNVKSSSINKKATTVSKQSQLDECLTAALKTKFEADSEKSTKSKIKGKITYEFKE